MVKRIYLVMLAGLNVVICVMLATIMWFNGPATFNPIVALLGLIVLALTALQGANAYYVEAYGRKLTSWWFPFGNYRRVPFALKLLVLLFLWAIVGYFVYLWALWLLTT